MGCLKLFVLDEQRKERAKEVRIDSKNPYRVSACSCPCWAFIKKGNSVILDDDIEVDGSWNID